MKSGPQRRNTVTSEAATPLRLPNLTRRFDRLHDLAHTLSFVFVANEDGVGSDDHPPRERIGLANTRARLERLYGAAQKFTAADLPAGGFVVEMVIPFHTGSG